MYAKASSDDTAKHKKCTENAKTSHQRMPWNANKTQKTCEKKHLSTKPMQKTRKMQKNAQNMQSKSKTNAIKNVLVFAFAFVLLCICVFLRLFFLHFLCVSLRKRTKMKKHAQKTHKQWKKQCKKIAQNGVVKIGCACACFFACFSFFELLFCFFLLFFLASFCIVFAFWYALFLTSCFVAFLCSSFAFPGHPLWVWFLPFFCFFYESLRFQS